MMEKKGYRKEEKYFFGILADGFFINIKYNLVIITHFLILSMTAL